MPQVTVSYRIYLTKGIRLSKGIETLDEYPTLPEHPHVMPPVPGNHSEGGAIQPLGTNGEVSTIFYVPNNGASFQWIDPDTSPSGIGTYTAEFLHWTISNDANGDSRNGTDIDVPPFFAGDDTYLTFWYWLPDGGTGFDQGVVEAIYLDENGGAPQDNETPIESCDPATAWKGHVNEGKLEDNIVHTEHAVTVHLSPVLPVGVRSHDFHWFQSYEVLDGKDATKTLDKLSFHVPAGGAPTVWAYYLGGVTVPNCIGLTLSQAELAVTNARLTVGHTQDLGVVFVDPEAPPALSVYCTKLSEEIGQLIKGLQFAKNNAPGATGGASDMTKDEKTLAALELEYQEKCMKTGKPDKDPSYDFLAPGDPIVVDQDPQAGVEVARGSSVNLSTHTIRNEIPGLE